MTENILASKEPEKSDKQGVTFPFLVTRVDLDKLILGFNAIKEFIHDKECEVHFSEPR